MFEVQPDVLIVGAGPVGLFTALTLAKRGIPVRIADSAFWTCAHSYALALHPQSLGLMKWAGIHDEILSKSQLVDKISFYEGSARKAEVKLEQPMAVVRQDGLEAVLEKALEKLGVPVLWRHAVSEITQQGDVASARMDRLEKESRGYVVAHDEWVVAKSTRLDVPWIIGADGYDSAVRNALEIGYPETGPAQFYAVFEFQSDEKPANDLRLALGDDTTDALWPLPNGHWRWSFQLPDYKVSNPLAGPGYFLTSRLRDTDPKPFEIPVLEESTLRSLLALRAPWFKGNISNVSWRTVVRFEQRQAANYGNGRVWLAGDSAHLTGPVGVQSMNLGLLEGYELANIIANGGHPAELANYNKHWTETWRQLHGLNGGLQMDSNVDLWIAARAARIIPCLPGHGRELAAMANHMAVSA